MQVIDESDKIARCAPLLGFQKNIARRWLSRAQGCDDPFGKFFFYFSGFNALYFAWAKADDLRNSREEEAGEGLQIKNLLQKLNPEEVEKILEQSSPAIKYFSSREPIQRMDRRSCKMFDRGEVDEGRSVRNKLGSSSHVDRLVALGKILYLVRCNLVHGSKAEMGDDERIIEASIGPLQLLLEITIEFTERQLSFDEG